MMSLTDADYVRAASLLGCEVAAIRAFAEVESKGDGFLDNGLPKILFEAHVFSRRTGHQYDISHPRISSLTWNKALYVGGAAEHERLDQAAALNRDAALQSASWGAFQIMGFNYKRAGFTSVQEFVNAMYRNEGEHLTAFCNCVKSFGLDDELRNLEWEALAEGYNGPSYAANQYHIKLPRAYARFKGA